jgi:hypothetical protein
VKVAGRGLTIITALVRVVVRLMCVLGCVRRRHRVGLRIVLWSLVAVVVLVQLAGGVKDVIRVVVAERWLTVTAQKVLINKARAVTVLAVVVGGLRWLVEQLGLTVVQTQIPMVEILVVGVTSVRLVRELTAAANRTCRVLVAVVVTVGMAAVVAAVRSMAVLVVAAVLVM